MTLNEKKLNYKVVDLVESYNFHIKFTSIWVQTIKLQIFEKRLDSYRRPPRRQMYSFAIFLDHIFLQNWREKNCKKRKKSKELECWTEARGVDRTLNRP
jgi:hypothetical protein